MIDINDFVEGSPMPIFVEGSDLPVFVEGTPLPTFGKGRTLSLLARAPFFSKIHSIVLGLR